MPMTSPFERVNTETANLPVCNRVRGVEGGLRVLQRAAQPALQPARRTGGVIDRRRALPAKPLASNVRNPLQARLDA